MALVPFDDRDGFIWAASPNGLFRYDDAGPVQAYPVSQPTMALPTPVPLQAAPPMVPMAPMPAAPVPEGALVLPPGR